MIARLAEIVRCPTCSAPENMLCGPLGHRGPHPARRYLAACLYGLRNVAAHERPRDLRTIRDEPGYVLLYNPAPLGTNPMCLLWPYHDRAQLPA